MLAHKVGDVRAADLLLALKQHHDIARECAVAGKQRLDRQQLREVLALVVAGAARVDPPIADGRLKRRRDTGAERVGRLHVVVTVQQHPWLPWGVVAPSIDHRPPGGMACECMLSTPRRSTRKAATDAMPTPCALMLGMRR